MGEAKRRHGLGAGPYASAQGRFERLGIETSSFGFYDSAPFLEEEKRSPEFLEQYAVWVKTRPRPPEYDAHVREVVPRLTDLLSQALHDDGMVGGCVAASGMMTRMLDRLGVWSYALHGCLTLEVEAQKLWRGYAVCDNVDFEGGMPGHSWVVAPPYAVIDPSLSLQRLEGDAIKPFVPSTLLSEDDFIIVKPEVSDVVAARVGADFLIREGRRDPQLHHRLKPNLRRFGLTFPAIEVTRGALRMRYVPVAVRQTDVDLEFINSNGKVGRPAIATWRETIAPAFGIAT